jgi:type I restriction enzyme, S subunit
VGRRNSRALGSEPLKWGVEYVEGPGIMAADFTVDGVPLIRIAGIGGRKATLDGCNYLSPELVSRRWEHFRVRCGDLLISGSASTGLCSEVDELTEGAVPYTGIIIVRPRQYTTERAFVRWFFLCGSFLIQAEIARSGSTIQHFGPSHLSRMLIVLPPLSEQRAIAAFLDRDGED